MPCVNDNTIFVGLGVGSNNYDEAAAKVKKKYNITKMKNWANPASPQWIDLQPLPPPVQYTPFCVPDYPCGDGVNGEKWCWPVDDTYYQPCATGSFDIYGVGGQQWHNCYSASQDTGSSLCHFYGFKAVVASGIWLGRKSYTSRELLKDDSMGWCCSCAGAGHGGFHKPDFSPDNVKYRTINADSTVEYNNDEYDFEVDPDPTECCCNEGGDCCPDCGCGEGDDGCSCTWGNCWTKTYTGTTTYTAYGNATCTIDKYGNLNGACSSGSSGWCDEADPDWQYACLANAASDGFSGCGSAESNYTSLIGMWCGGIRTWMGCEGCHAPDVLDWDDSTGTGHAEWHTTIYDSNGCGCIIASHDVVAFEMTLTQTTFDSTTYGINNIVTSGCPCQGYSPEWVVIGTTHADYGTTDMHASSFGFNPSWSSAFTGTRTSEGSLEDGYGPQEVYDDTANNLLSTWDFGDTKVYPWRNASDKTRMPWVSRDATGGAPSVGYCSSSHTYTGRICGAPGPEGISPGVWNPSAPVMCVCDDPNDPGNFCQYTDHYGQWSQDGCSVPRATQWLQVFHSNNMPDGAMVGSNFMYTMPCRNNSNGPSKISDDVIWMVKYAELVNPNISPMIWGRPCGADRWQISSSGTNCIREFSGSTVTIDVGEYGGGPNYIAEGTVSICGTGERDGIYECTGVGADTVTVGDCLVSASNFPFPLYNNCGTGFIGNCKWPETFGLCGSSSINFIEVSASTAKITLDQPSWLITGDEVQIFGVQGISGVNGTQTLYQVDSKNYYLDGATASGSYLGGGKIKCLFSLEQKWYAKDPQMMVQNKQWFYNFRDVGEHYRLEASYPYEVDQLKCDPSPCGYDPYPDCVPCTPTPIPPNPRINQCGIDQNVTTMSCATVLLDFNGCAQPTAVYYSPNTEHFGPQSKNLGFHFPGMDSQYGSMWQGIPQQTMDDPIAPYQPCLCGPDIDENTEYVSYDCYACSFSEDDGTCQSDQNGDPELGIPCRKYYAAHDIFKGRCRVPDGCPPMPHDVKIGCATTPPADCSGNVCGAPFAPSDFPDGDTCFPYLVYVYENPWALYQTKEGCVCYEGRFADTYSRNGVECNTDEFPPP